MTKYKNNSTLKLLIIGILCLANLFGNVFAIDDTNFTTNNGNGGNKPHSTAGEKGWATQSVTCTTYTLAYIDSNGETKTLDPTRYLITHAANGVLDEDGNLKLTREGVPASNTISKENRGYTEDVYIGCNSPTTTMNKVISDGQLFEDKATSAKNYTGENRHVVNWLANNQGKIYAADSGAGDNDKKVLWELAYKQAQANGDTETMKILENIQNGTLQWAIKQEVKLAVRTPVEVSYHEDGMDIETSVNGWSLLTYDELNYVNDRSSGYKYGSTIRDYWKTIFGEIYEDDEQYAQYLKNGKLKGGFDWIMGGNTFPPTKTVVTQIWITTKNDIIAGPRDYIYKDGETTHHFSKDDYLVDETKYKYKETKKDDGPGSPEEDIPADNQRHTIIYIYDAGNTVTVYYMEKPGSLITSLPPEPISKDQTVTANYKTPEELEKAGYGKFKYINVETYKETELLNTSTSTSASVTGDGESSYKIIFWYERVPENLIINVYHVCDSNNCGKDILSSSTITIPIKKDQPVNHSESKGEFTNHTYKHYTKVTSEIPISYPAGGTQFSDTTAQIYIPANSKIRYVEIVFHYNCEKAEEENKDAKGEIEHIYIDPLTGEQKTIGWSDGTTTVVGHWEIEEEYYILKKDEGKENPKKYSTPQYDDDGNETTVKKTIENYVIDYDEWTIRSNCKLDGGHLMYRYNNVLVWYTDKDGNKIDEESSSIISQYRYTPTSSSTTVITQHQSEHTGQIFYTDQKLNVKHWLAKTSMTDTESLGGYTDKISTDAGTGSYFAPRYGDSDYKLIAIKLNGVWVKGGERGALLNDSGYTVKLLEGQASQDIEFYYKLSPDSDNNTGKGTPVVCEVTVDKDTCVLDEKFNITIPNSGKHEEAWQQGYSVPDPNYFWTPMQPWNLYFASKKTVTFNMAVEYNGQVYKAGTQIDLETRDQKATSKDKSNFGTKYEFTVPVWNEDNKSYDINAKVIPTGNNSGVADRAKFNIVTKSAAGCAIDSDNIKLIGKIYDFTVTNIQGDDMWKKILSLPTDNINNEYKADRLPVGQENQKKSNEAKKYNSAIKKGTKVYFSVNTKGIANSEIKIVPKYYYIAKDNTKLVEVDAFVKNAAGKYVKLNGNRTSTTSNPNKMTKEFGQEKLKAKNLYSGIKFDTTSSIGAYQLIKLGNAFKFPYLNYLKIEEKDAFGAGKKWKGKEDENTIYKAVSHWYGDYMIPGDAQFAPAGTSEAQAVNMFKNYNDGYILITFKINSTLQNGTDYLLYDSNQWKKEDIKTRVDLPKISAKASPKSIDISYIINANYGPVIIYQSNISVTQNYDTTGTH